MALIKRDHHHSTGSRRAMASFLRVATATGGSSSRCISVLSAMVLFILVAFVTQSYSNTNNSNEQQQDTKKLSSTHEIEQLKKQKDEPIVESTMLAWDRLVEGAEQRVKDNEQLKGDFATPQARQACAALGIPSWILQLRPTLEEQFFSQNGEDGITRYILQNVAPSSLLVAPTAATTTSQKEEDSEKYYVEFGVQSGEECNTRILREHYNWTGLLMDGGFDNATIGLQREMIHPDTVVDLFQKYNVPTTFGLLSEDTDYADFFIWQSILKAGYRPRVLISEINSNFVGSSVAFADSETTTQHDDLESESVTVHAPGPDQARLWDHTDYFGVSALALKRLWNKYGYIMIYCTERQVNCFGIHESDALQLPALQQLENNNDSATSRATATAVAQECLWNKPMTWPKKIHPCNKKFESWSHVDRNGNLVANSTVFPLVVQYCRKMLQPKDFVKVKVNGNAV